MKKIALISPSKNAYSETFIQEHKRGLEGNVSYFYHGDIPTMQENKGVLRAHFIERVGRSLNRVMPIFKFKFTQNASAFRRALHKESVDLVFAEYGTTAHNVLHVVKDLNLPLVTHFHGFDISVYNVLSKCDNYSEVFEYSSFIVAVSKEMVDDLVRLGCDRSKIVYTPCGPHSSFLGPSLSLDSQDFLSVGRFTDKKAPYYLILAFKKVLESYPESKFIIGGRGYLLNTCKNLVKALGIERNVTFPGVITREEFQEYISKSRAYVQHSVRADNGDKEGTPVAIMEASLSGLPVISTFHAGIPDVILDGKSGLLIEEHDVDAMAEKMIKILEDKELAIQLGKNGQNHIKDNFTLEHHLEVLNTVISRVCKA